MPKEPGGQSEEAPEEEIMEEEYIAPELERNFAGASTETLEELITLRSANLDRNKRDIQRMNKENFFLEEQLKAARAELKKRKK